MVYLISYKMVLQKVGAWGLRPRQVGVKGDAALGGGIPNPLLALPEWLATEAGKHIATAEAGIREGGKHLATAPYTDREARFQKLTGYRENGVTSETR